MKKRIYLFVLAVISLTAYAENAVIDLPRQTNPELQKAYSEATTNVVRQSKSSLHKARKAPVQKAAPTDIVGQYIYTTITNDEINSSGMITIAAGDAAGTYLVTGLHENQIKPVVGTYAGGVLTIAPGQAGLVDEVYGTVPLYQMVDDDHYSSSANIVLEFDESGSVELTSGVGFYMPIVEGEYSGYTMRGTSTGSYFAYAPNGNISSHLVNSDFSDAAPANETYPTFTGFFEESGSLYALVAGVDGVTFITIKINDDNSVQTLQEACYYYSSSYKPAYPCQGVNDAGVFKFYSSTGPTGTINYEAGTITLDMWAFFMQNTAGTGYASVLGRKSPSVITFPGFTPDIPLSSDFACNATAHSKFIENSQVNSYKNTLALSLKGATSGYVNNTYTVKRKNKATGAITNVCQITFTQTGNKNRPTYNYRITYSSQMTTTDPLRYDGSSLPTQNGAVSSGITIADYFTASTAEGGDKADAYIYTVEGGKLCQVPVYAASVYAWPSAADGTDAYSLEQIAADTDHSLEAQGAYTIYLDEYTDGVEAVQVYQDHSSVGSIEFHDALLLSSNVTPVSDFSIALKVGDNTYGTNEASAFAAVLNDLYAYDMMKSEMTFNGGSRYFNCFLNVALNSVQGVSFETTGGGFRVWRSCDSSDEYYEALNNRANDFLFFDNVGLEESAMSFEGIGSEKLTLGSTTYNSGTFGSASETPMVIMRVRAYYKPSSANYAPRKVKAMDAEEEVYSIAEATLEVVFEENVATGLKEVTSIRPVREINYYNVAGQASKTPHKGVNIIVTTYGDGSTSTRKQIVH